MIEKPDFRTTVLVVLFVGVAYFVVGYVFGELDDLGVTPRGVFLWRLGAWVFSAGTFAVHLWLEYARFRNTPFAIALHAALAVAFGAFLLAVAATFHAAWIESSAPLWRYYIALVAWPIFTAVPAFLVAVIVATGLTRFVKIADR
jgi:NADH:ubiquinone oxidoreductase subunit 5 (subunit L)/multisubunit Na+/H+ antiporter MnhA subunit